MIANTVLNCVSKYHLSLQNLLPIFKLSSTIYWRMSHHCFRPLIRRPSHVPHSQKKNKTPKVSVHLFAVHANFCTLTLEIPPDDIVEDPWMAILNSNLKCGCHQDNNNCSTIPGMFFLLVRPLSQYFFLSTMFLSAALSLHICVTCFLLTERKQELPCTLTWWTM